MNRFFIDRGNIDLSKKTAKINDKNDIKHISKVLRLKVGELIELCDKEEREYTGEITSIENEILISNLIEIDVKRESNLKITLFQGIPKGDKMDLIIQKNVELGVKEVIPVQMKRSVSKIDDKKKNSKLERWEKIAYEAAKQSKRSIIPKVERILNLNEVIGMIDTFDMFLVAYENEDMTYLSDLKGRNLSNLGILIGPEGGIDEAEIESLMKNGATVISLGRRILRTETAGFTLNSVLQYEFGDLG